MVEPKQIKRKRAAIRAITITQVKRSIANEVPANRREKILEYLKLFGYKPDKTILQVYEPGYFGKRAFTQREIERRESARRRYGGTTFVIVGRTHDPYLAEVLIKPRKQTDTGYLGYLWKEKNRDKKPPHELLPLDFTPVNLKYPSDWKEIFSNKGFIVALHVPTSLAPHKNKITRALYRAGKDVDIKGEWKFLDKLKNEIEGNEK